MSDIIDAYFADLSYPASVPDDALPSPRRTEP